MYDLNQIQSTMATGGAKSPESYALSNDQLSYLGITLAQTAVTVFASTPVGVAGKLGYVGLNVVATATAQAAGNYFFPSSK